MPSYFASLRLPRLILWCYLCWYLTIAVLYFDPSPGLWLSSLGISSIIGSALLLSIHSPGRRLDRWTVFRLFLMPFCVSSYSCLIKGRNFLLIFPPELKPNLLALAACAGFLTLCLACRTLPQARRAGQPAA
ncbi:MAG: hypothetical protein JF599_02215 [Verrucomicrobia bacterium]|nr:hypothetical protein [Verrucomicrobiota bacterium]